VDAGRPVAPTELRIRTPTPGFGLEVYGAGAIKAPRALDGWTKLGAKQAVKRNARVALDAKREGYRHILLWVTSLPPGGGAVKIADVRVRA
jgi:hypothetical protein